MGEFDYIPDDRNDECCPNCGEGWLTRPRFVRNMGRFRQYIYECKNCGGDVVMIDEDKDQMCPFCGEENAFTLTRLNELNYEYEENIEFIKFIVKLYSDDLTDGDTPSNDELEKIYNGLKKRYIDPTEFELFEHWNE